MSIAADVLPLEYAEPGEKVRVWSAKEKEEILAQALKRWELAHDYERENREHAIEDLEILLGGDGQWDRDVLDQRRKYKLPVITINRIRAFVNQVANDLRQNRPAIKVTPKDDQASMDKAALFSGLIRNIEYNSKADIAYDHATEVSIGAGYYGFFRVITRYSTDDCFDQDIIILPIWDSFSVTLDPYAIEPDGSDRSFAHVVEEISRDEFEERYPDDAGEWETRASEYAPSWEDTDNLRRVAEYWWREMEAEQIVQMVDGSTLDKELVDENDLWEFAARDPQGAYKIREVMRPKVYWCKMTSRKVLEGPVLWPGKYIPIVPVEPLVTWFQGKKVLSGLTREAKGAQQYYNYDRSRRAEIMALAPKAPYIGTAKQFDGLHDLWQVANTEPLAFLPYNPDSEAPGPPQRQAPPDIPQGMVQEGLQCIDDIKSTMGIFDASLGNQGNETSGKAIRARQTQADRGYFHFSDNLNRAIRFLGNILVDLVPKIYDSERIVRVMGEDGAVSLQKINQPLPDGMVLNDLSVGKYDVVVTSGPSYASQRLEESEAMLELLQAVPQIGPSITDLVVAGMPFPNADKIAQRIRMSMPPQLLGQQAPPPPPDPRLQAAQIQLQGTQAKTQAEVQKAQLDVQGKALDVAAKQHGLAHQVVSHAQDLQAQQQQAQQGLNPAQTQQDQAIQHAVQIAAARQAASQQTAAQRQALQLPLPGIPRAYAP